MKTISTVESSNIVVKRNGHPFASKGAATRAMKTAGYSTAVVEIEGGFGYLKELPVQPVAANADEHGKLETKFRELARKLFMAGLDTALGRKFKPIMIQLFKATTEHPLYKESPVLAFSEVGRRTMPDTENTTIDGIQDKAVYDDGIVRFGVEVIFQAAVQRICAAQRKKEMEYRILSRQNAKAGDIVDNSAPTDLYSMEAADRDEVADYVTALDHLYIECAKIWFHYASTQVKQRVPALPWASELTDEILGTRENAYSFEQARAMSDRYSERQKVKSQLETRQTAKALDIKL